VALDLSLSFSASSQGGGGRGGGDNVGGPTPAGKLLSPQRKNTTSTAFDSVGSSNIYYGTQIPPPRRNSAAMKFTEMTSPQLPMIEEKDVDPDIGDIQRLCRSISQRCQGMTFSLMMRSLVTMTGRVKSDVENVWSRRFSDADDMVSGYS